jgi:hypothetical protein
MAVGGIVTFAGIAVLIAGNLVVGGALLFFGVVFAGAGYGTTQAFQTPEGMRKVVDRTEEVQSVNEHGRTGTTHRTSYRYVDDDVTDEELREEREQEEDKPWLARPEWTSPTFTYSFDRTAGAWGCAALFGGLVSAVVLGVFFGFDLHEDGLFGWIVLGFPVIALVWTVQYVRARLRARAFDNAALTFDPYPPVLGETLQATLDTGIPNDVEPDDGVQVTVTCYRRETTLVRDDDGPSQEHVERTELWQGRRQEKPVRDGSGTLGATVEMPLPTDPPPSTPEELANRIEWHLEASASVPGVDWSVDWEIPVFEARGEKEEGGGGDSEP